MARFDLVLLNGGPACVMQVRFPFCGSAAQGKSYAAALASRASLTKVSQHSRNELLEMRPIAAGSNE
jgi:hypothetical protein